MVAERSTLAIYTAEGADWKYTIDTANALGLDKKRVQIRQPLGGSPSR